MCFAKTNGAVKCPGTNSNYQSGTGYKTNSIIFLSSTLTFNVVCISAEMYHSCSLVYFTGQVKCWGGDKFGQLGIGNYTDTAMELLTNNRFVITLVPTFCPTQLPCYQLNYPLLCQQSWLLCFLPCYQQMTLPCYQPS